MTKKKILLIDDEERLLDLLGDFVEDMGHDVEMQPKSALALEAFQNNPSAYKMIITDHTMPELSGLDLIAKVRLIDTDIPCVLTSGAALDEIDGLLESDSNFHYLKKPYKRRHLQELLDKFNF
ncbi:response regulator [Halobacteriovorax sp. HLS]|uniref:response regulator n=1 Tax=Halobacteriovorax sp. HLS TaxID=2234000 RepID=UPI000FD92E5D|nr:response regulator [Halobacteriovorax sp. HLS]